MADISTPTKRCHNCRRQRLRCDRSYPHCNKCLLAGKECLGYGHLFRWTGAIASRGKLAGKTSSADVSAVPSTSPNEPKDHRTSKVKEARKDDRRPARSRSNSPQTPAPVAFVTEDYPRAQDRDSREIVRRSETPDADFSSPWVLADPLVQDLSYSYRHYLSYCTYFSLSRRTGPLADAATCSCQSCLQGLGITRCPGSQPFSRAPRLDHGEPTPPAHHRRCVGRPHV